MKTYTNDIDEGMTRTEFQVLLDIVKAGNTVTLNTEDDKADTIVSKEGDDFLFTPCNEMDKSLLGAKKVNAEKLAAELSDTVDMIWVGSYEY